MAAGAATSRPCRTGSIKSPARFAVLSVQVDSSETTYAVVTVKRDGAVTVTPEISLDVPYEEFVDTGRTGLTMRALTNLARLDRWNWDTCERASSSPILRVLPLIGMLGGNGRWPARGPESPVREARAAGALGCAAARRRKPARRPSYDTCDDDCGR